MNRVKFVAKITAGQSPSSDDVEMLNNGHPFLQGKAEFGDHRPTPRYECAVAPKQALRDDVLVSVRAPVGAINVADQEYGIGRGLASVRAATIHPGYLRWVLENAEQWLRTEATGSTFEAVTTATLGNVPVTHNELPVQKRIADHLDRETSEIDAMTAKMDKLAGSLGERRRNVSVAVLAPLFKGATSPLWSVLSPIKIQGYPYEEVLSVYREYGVIPKSSRDDNHNRTPDSLANYQLVLPGDLVINKMKAWQGSMGVSDYRGIVSPDYQVAQPTRRVVSRYLHAVLRSQIMVPQYRVHSIGVRPSQWRLYWNNFAGLAIPIPSLAEQERIADYLDEATSRIDGMLAKVAELKSLLTERRAALITDVVTGRKEVA